MARDVSDATPIESRDQLVATLESGGKPKSAWRVGTEHEKFGFYLADNSPVPYEGDRGIRRLLEAMEGLLGWHPIVDDDRIIGLTDPLGLGAISLEPGGQFCDSRRAMLCQQGQNRTPGGVARRFQDVRQGKGIGLFNHSVELHLHNPSVNLMDE